MVYPVNEQNATQVIRFMLNGALLTIVATNAVVKNMNRQKHKATFQAARPTSRAIYIESAR